MVGKTRSSLMRCDLGRNKVASVDVHEVLQGSVFLVMFRVRGPGGLVVPTVLNLPRDCV